MDVIRRQLTDWFIHLFSLGTSTSTSTTGLIYPFIFANIVFCPVMQESMIEFSGDSCMFGYFSWLKVVTTYWRAQRYSLFDIARRWCWSHFMTKHAFAFSRWFLLNDVKPKRLSEGACIHSTTLFQHPSVNLVFGCNSCEKRNR